MSCNKTNSDTEGFQKLLRVAPVEAKSLPKRKRSVFVIPTQGEGTLVLKPLRIGSLRAFLTVKLLSSKPACGILPNLAGVKKRGCFHWDRGNRFLITRYIEGREADYLLNSDLEVAIRTMAVFHRFTTEVLRQGSSLWDPIRFDPQASWRNCLHEMERCRKIALRLRNNWSSRYLKLWHYFTDQANRAIENLNKVKPFGPSVVCYHDWACHNLLIQNGKGYLVDFDAILIDHPVHDRTNLISRYLRLHYWSKDALLCVLRSFERNYPWKQGELELLGIYLMFPYDYWILGRQYFLERQPWSLRYYEDQWQRKIQPYREREKLLHWMETLK